MYVHYMCALCFRRLEEGIRSSGTEITEGFEPSLWVLEIKLGFSAKEARALKPWAMSPVPHLVFEIGSPPFTWNWLMHLDWLAGDSRDLPVSPSLPTSSVLASQVHIWLFYMGSGVGCVCMCQTQVLMLFANWAFSLGVPKLYLT